MILKLIIPLVESGVRRRFENFFTISRTHIPHPQLSHNENWSFGDLELAIAYQYSLSLVQNTTFGRNEITKKPIVTPGGAEGRLESQQNAHFFRYTLKNRAFWGSQTQKFGDDR